MRIASIDICRALTMVLMIWVNDFWTLTNIPKWLTHAKANEDYMGFSDIIFPLFLFIVGLSIPYAIKNRVLKNEKTVLIAKHILIRALSLLFIGFFMVNYESIHEESMLIGKYTWCLLMAFAVVLIWMHWKKSPVSKKWHIYLQVFGFTILLFLAVIYKGGSLGENWMKPHWWGILGLIGWAYGVNALVYLYSKRSLPIMIVLLFIFNILCIVNSIYGITSENEFIRAFSPIYTGTVPAFTTAGIIVILLFQKLSGSAIKWRYISLITLGIVQIIYGLATRPYWGISKIQGTPSWLAICTGIGILLFVLLYYITDVKKQVHWAKIIAPAGTATLTCYMIPYFIYPIRNMIDIRLPDYLNTSIIGLFLSFVFALLVVIFTGLAQQKRFTLKL
ncbi:heparan-alpha-glucosaminide N-acetyltransferase domain-containing protein [Aquimarina muelleri]|uniref:heparan-alpha-glucosaminide N-acetyltransferase domain-containing protein n=1 Tax=Aquimarina muelleri TaxID=279356 RepID=UPI003F683664